MVGSRALESRRTCWKRAWLGRYTERAERTLRLLRTALDAGELLGVLARTTVPGPVPPPAEVSNVVAAVFEPEEYGGLITQSTGT